jgi:hypothetical protein
MRHRRQLESPTRRLNTAFRPYSNAGSCNYTSRDARSVQSRLAVRQSVFDSPCCRGRSAARDLICDLNWPSPNGVNVAVAVCRRFEYRRRLFVYRSEFAGTNKATAVTWVADEVEDIVKTLKGRGVSFEHYDLPSMTRQGDLHVAGTLKAAWFKDPDGNIFSLVTPPNTAMSQTVGASARSTA